VTRLAWLQLRFQTTRALALLAGMLLATTAFTVLTVADVVFLSIRERAAEVATMRALGWPESALGRLVITEGVISGMAGSLAGALIGLVRGG
jgi:putative ABC transport system permease protein